MGWAAEMLAAVAPGYAARRAEAGARRAAALLQKRHMDQWRVNDPSRRGPEVRAGRPLGRYDRARIREVLETNPFAIKAMSSLLNDIVGWGITGVPKGSKKLIGRWKRWTALCDYDGVNDLYGEQELAVRTLLADGEVFIVRYIDQTSITENPLRIQVLDADMLDGTAVAQTAGARCRDGIEYDATGRPVAYNFRGSREASLLSAPRRITAENVIHLFRRRRPGQWRGRSHFESILEPLDRADGYIEAEAVRKQVESCFVAFVTPSEENVDGDTGTVGAAQDDGFEEETLTPGLIKRLRGGEQVSFGTPRAVAGMNEFMKWTGLRVAAGARITFEDASGDLSNVNFSSYKAGALNKKRFVGRLQYLTIIPGMLDRIWSWWLEAEAMTGNSVAGASIAWTPPPFESIDRLGDAQADQLEMEIRTESRRRIVAAKGYDDDELQAEIAGDRKTDAKYGLAEPILQPSGTNDADATAG